SSDAVANHAWLSLGGLRMGWSDSAWDTTPAHGAAHVYSHSDSGLRTSAGQRNFIQYNFTGGNGFFATVSLEDDNGDGIDAGPTGWAIGPYAATHDNNNYVPDVVVKAGVNQG